jgi:uncharacterized C2H2 Zn-finger protein
MYIVPEIKMAVSVAEASWPWLTRRDAFGCPGCHGIWRLVSSIILHLNDYHQWTRERIAEWVAKIEPQDIQGEQADEGQETRIAVLEATEA